LLLLLLSGVLQAAVPDEAPLDWLRRMTQAGDSLDYQGVLVYSHADTLTSFRLTHVNDGGHEWEHLVQLDGRANEVVRGGGDLIYRAPGGTSTRMRFQPSASLRPDTSLDSLDSIDAHYLLTLFTGERVAGRNAVRIILQPHDMDRYGHVFYLDQATGLLLKSQLLDADGTLLETMGFSSVNIGPDVGRSEYLSARHVAALHVHAPVTTLRAVPKPLPPRWQLAVPDGFVMGPEGIRAKRMNGSRVEVATYSDGLSSFSVFSEPVGASHPHTGQGRRGSTTFVSRLLDEKGGNWLITVVGEIPLATSQQIADSVQPLR
jgi:sigma-E factor negative regulatory protein RseB